MTDTTATATVISLPGNQLAPVVPFRTEWPRKTDGSVDWRAVAMQCPEHFYVKSDAKEKAAKLLNKPVEAIRDLGPEDIVKVPDWMLVIRKAGILRLARLRGYRSALPEVKSVMRDYVVIQTWIDWDEFNDGKNVVPAKTTGGVGEACPENTTRLGAAYLAATAENRAFSRAVRQYLEIDIVSSDELGADGVEPEQKSSGTASSATPTSGTTDNGPALAVGTPAHTLKSHADGSKLSFEQVKNYALALWNSETEQAADPQYKRKFEGDPTEAKTWTDFKPRDCLTLITAIQKARELETVANENRHSFESIRKAAQNRWDADTNSKVAKRSIITDPSKWTRWFDIHYTDCATLIELIKVAKAAREENKAAKQIAAPAPTAPVATETATATSAPVAATPKRTRKATTTSPSPSTGTQEQAAA